MSRCFPVILCLGTALLALVVSASAEPGKNGEANVEWAPESSVKGVVIQSRLHQGSALKEYKSVSVIEADPGLVFAVLNDSENYASFMPYTSECRVLKREKDRVLAYQRLNLPFVSDRDFTLRSQNAKWLGPEGTIFRIRWTTANDEGPAAKPGVTRVQICEGGWLLEPEGSGFTRATYSVFTDSGGTLPTFVANGGSQIAIRKVFEAVRKQVKNPKYGDAKSATRNTGAD